MPPTIVPHLDRVVQLGVEGTPGALPAATMRLGSLKIVPEIKADAQEETPTGYKYPTIAVLGQEWSIAKVDGKPTYGEIIYPFSGLMGAAAITPLTLGTISRQWQWIQRGPTLDTPVTFAVEEGDSARANKFGYGLFAGAGVKMTRQGVTISGNMLGQQTQEGITLTPLTPVNAVNTLVATGATAGNFTLTVNGVVITGVNWNSTAAALQAKFDTAIGAGNVLVTGATALPAGPLTMSFQGNYGNQPVSLVADSTGLTGGTAVVATTTAGVGITPEPVMIPIVAKTVDCFVDTSGGGFGGTRFSSAFDAEWGFTDKYETFWPLDSTLASFGGALEKMGKPDLKVNLGANEEGRAFLDGIRNNTKLYMRLQATGPVIEGTIHYSAVWDMCLLVKSVGSMKAFQGYTTRDFVAGIAHDNGVNFAQKITVVNRQASL